MSGGQDGSLSQLRCHEKGRVLYMIRLRKAILAHTCLKRLVLASAAAGVFALQSQAGVIINYPDFSSTAGLDVPLEGPIGDLTRSGMHVRKGSLTEKVTRLGSRRLASRKPEKPEQP